MAVMFAVKWEEVEALMRSLFPITETDERNDRHTQSDSINITLIRYKNMDGIFIFSASSLQGDILGIQWDKRGREACVFGWMSNLKLNNSASECKSLAIFLHITLLFINLWLSSTACLWSGLPPLTPNWSWQMCCPTLSMLLPEVSFGQKGFLPSHCYQVLVHRRSFDFWGFCLLL